MEPETALQGLARLLYAWTDNTISLIGVIVTTSSAVTLIAFWIYDFMLPGPPHPYAGILLFLILLLVCGIAALCCGASSTESQDSPEWKRRLERGGIF